MPAFALQPVDETFFESAREVQVGTFDIAKPASEVWAELVADGALSFCRSLRGARWTSPRPFGVGTTRTMPALYGLLVVDEVFFRWEEGRRKSFYVERANLPMFTSLAEDYLVEEVSPSQSRFTWTLAMEPTALGRLGSPLNARVVDGIIQDMRRHFS
ncbi:MAG TPA: SRPBCC family protein [Aeromicrobium sp.]|nr:SRPBCC family protein [Aeromicrobium sp.]